MERTKATEFAPGIENVRDRIEEWRRTREKRTRMPEDLWQAAVDLARDHGPWSISRALRVRYETLRRRLGESSTETEPADKARFVELGSAIASTEVASSSVTVELSRGDGTRLTVRLPSDSAVDVKSLIGAFCRP